jgi:hypothetical protein
VGFEGGQMPLQRRLPKRGFKSVTAQYNAELTLADLQRLGERFFQSSFREKFEAKGRFRGYLADIPTALITDTLAALTGAAAALDQGVG